MRCIINYKKDQCDLGKLRDLGEVVYEPTFPDLAFMIIETSCDLEKIRAISGVIDARETVDGALCINPMDLTEFSVSSIIIEIREILETTELPERLISLTENLIARTESLVELNGCLYEKLLTINREDAIVVDGTTFEAWADDSSIEPE